MGIAPDEIDQIFELYKQAGQSPNRHYRGTGLGLAVVRGKVEDDPCEPRIIETVWGIGYHLDPETC